MNRSPGKNKPANNQRLHRSQALPTGTLTFLFTDIEGSTRLWDLYPVKMHRVMVRHDELIESIVSLHKGMLIRPRGEGDSRFAVFPRATDALLASIAIQRRILSEPWSIPTPRLRIALHSGEADLREGDYYGNSVNRCARIRSAAHGGQILVSETTRDLVRDDMPAGVHLRGLGEYDLRGLERAELIFQVVVAVLPAEFPPLHTPDRVKNNLPLALTSFIGREKDVEELEHLIWSSRLLTIMGPGGAGKTRLAIKVAQNLLGSFTDGTWFIDLAALTKNADVYQHVVNILGREEETLHASDQTLLDALLNKALLLVLDNCEHLLPDVAVLVEKVLRSAPGVRILATSREKLGAPGEVIWQIPPLTSPASQAVSDIAVLMQYESVRLFQERAAATKPNFAITVENAAAVAQISWHLDGNPLAIELAAARVRVLSVEEILVRLNDRFHFLVGNQTALPRQQTLRALVDWSYELLTEKERLLLRRLSVFSGSWSLQAAEQVCSGGGIEEWEVLDLLSSLVDKSLVSADTRTSHERYRFLETIHKFSQEQLSANNETEEFAGKHAEYFRSMTVSSYGKEWGSEQATWLSWLDQEYENLRAVLEWLSRQPGSEEAMLQLTGSLWRYWDIRGYISEGRAWLGTALEKNSSRVDYWRANGLGSAGHLARQQGDYEQAKNLHEQSLSLFRQLGLKLDTARQLNALGEIARYQGEYPRSIELHEESLTLRNEIDDKEGIAVSLGQLGVIAIDQGQYMRAIELLEKSLELERELGDRLLMARTLNDLGLAAYHLGEYDRAIAQFDEAISGQRELGDTQGISNSMHNMANVTKDQGKFSQAVTLYRECLELKEKLGDKRGIVRVTAALAEVAFWQGKYPQAIQLAGQCFSLAQALGLKRSVVTALILQGYSAYYQGNYAAAASFAEKSLQLSMEMDARQAVGYIQALIALGEYSQGKLIEARDAFQAAMTTFQEINDHRNIASTYVNLARTTYRLGDHDQAMRYLEESLSISKKLDIRWTIGYVLEIMGLLQRSRGNYRGALDLFLESLRLSVEMENLQGIANCFGALAGLAIMFGEARRATRIFAAAARLRREMGARMSNNDRSEYEHYLGIVHEYLDHATFEVEWSEGFSMPIDKVIEDLDQWSNDFKSKAIAKNTMHLAADPSIPFRKRAKVA